MGQTLTHGVYLPDEGERNCYSGLAANWQLLDNSVGTVAEHASQIAGKAPLVHTHTKSDITDFPAYGTTAGTICEGNDSRLSDARTPVAHTHTKSDVTDLFNSANTWSALNGYRKGIWLDGAREAYIFPESAASYSGLTFATEAYSQSFKFGDFTTSNDEVSFNYNNAYLNISAGYYSGDNKNKIEISPRNADESSLGNSTNKWKTFNGINPGALSIFNPSATQDPIDVPNTWVTDGSAWNTLNVSNMGDGWICLTYRPCGTNDYILVRFGSASAAYPSMIFPATMLHDSKYYLYLLVPIAKAMGNIYLEINLDSNAVLVTHCFIPSYGTV